MHFRTCYRFFRFLIHDRYINQFFFGKGWDGRDQPAIMDQFDTIFLYVVFPVAFGGFGRDGRFQEGVIGLEFHSGFGQIREWCLFAIDEDKIDFPGLAQERVQIGFGHFHLL